MATNPFSRTAIGFDLTKPLAVPANDPLLPSGINDSLQALQQAVGQSLSKGSFSARHPIGAAILSALGTGVLGGIAGSMDDTVGAGRGAALGALMGGIQAPLMEQQRRNTVTGKYLELAPKLLEYQKNLEEMRKGRAGAEFLAKRGEAMGFDTSYMRDAKKRALPGLSDALLTREFGTQLSSDALGGLAEQLKGGLTTGLGVGNTAIGPMPGTVKPQALPGSMPGTIQPMPMSASASDIKLELDPTVNGSQQPLQGGVSEMARPAPGSRGVAGMSEDVLKTIIPALAANQRWGLTASIDIPDMLARAANNNAQAKEILDKLPYEIKAILAETAQRNAAASLANRTNPNLRSGGGTRNVDIGPARLRMEQLKTIAGNPNTFGQEASRQAQQELLDMAGIEAPTPTPDVNNNDGAWLQELFQSAFRSDKGRN